MKELAVDFVSPVEFSGLAAEISCEGQVLCRVKKERLDGMLEVEFNAVLSEPTRVVVIELTNFLATLQRVAAEVDALDR